MEILLKKQEFLWQKLDSAMEFAENTSCMAFLLHEMDIIKARILELETYAFYNEIEQNHEL